MENILEIYFPPDKETELESTTACLVINGSYIEVPFARTDDGIILLFDLMEVEGHG